MKKIPIILDADPGIDDALALLLLYRFRDRFDLKLFASTAGNNPIEVVTNNLKFFANKFFKNVPVAQGNPSPIVRLHPNNADDVHGECGLGEFVAPKQNLENIEDSMLAMARVLEESEEKVTIIALGALTNIARLIINYPQLREKIECIYTMIGSIQGIGNIEPYAEFNAYFDPEALDLVVKSGVRLIVNPIELGLESKIKKSVFEDHESQNENHEMIKAIVRGIYESKNPDSFCLFDPNTVVALIKPEFYEFVSCDIEIYTNSEVRGKCVMTPNPNGKHVYQVLKDKEKVNEFIVNELFSI